MIFLRIVHHLGTFLATERRIAATVRCKCAAVETKTWKTLLFKFKLLLCYGFEVAALPWLLVAGGRRWWGSHCGGAAGGESGW